MKTQPELRAETRANLDATLASIGAEIQELQRIQSYLTNARQALGPDDPLNLDAAMEAKQADSTIASLAKRIKGVDPAPPTPPKAAPAPAPKEAG